MQTYRAVALSSWALARGSAGAAVVAYQEDTSCQLGGRKLQKGLVQEEMEMSFNRQKYMNTNRYRKADCKGEYPASPQLTA
ncbi:hypothetical protein GCM10025794_31200 [Massilia kyonggiensis]|jgi:hypothetical protein